MPTKRSAIVAALFTCWGAGVAAQQGRTLSATEIEGVKKEVTEAVDKYYRLFTAQDIETLPRQVCNIPWILMTANGPQPDLTAEQAQARFEASLKQLTHAIRKMAV